MLRFQKERDEHTPPTRNWSVCSGVSWGTDIHVPWPHDESNDAVIYLVVASATKPFHLFKAPEGICSYLSENIIQQTYVNVFSFICFLSQRIRTGRSLKEPAAPSYIFNSDTNVSCTDHRLYTAVNAGVMCCECVDVLMVSEDSLLQCCNYCLVFVRHQMKNLQPGQELRKVSSCSRLHEALLCSSGLFVVCVCLFHQQFKIVKNETLLLMDYSCGKLSSSLFTNFKGLIPGVYTDGSPSHKAAGSQQKFC